MGPDVCTQLRRIREACPSVGLTSSVYLVSNWFRQLVIDMLPEVIFFLVRGLGILFLKCATTNLGKLELMNKARQYYVKHFCHFKTKSTALAELQENYAMALNKVESENQRLQKELEETRATLGISFRVLPDNYESTALQRQHQVTEIKNTESR